MEDCGDDVVWEMGKLRPIADPRNLHGNPVEASFFKRLALSLSAYWVAWLAARGKKVAFALEPQSLSSGGGASMDTRHRRSR